MAYDIRVIRVRDFVRTDVSGMLDLASTRQVLHDLAAVCVQHPDQHILLDVREATDTTLTASQVYYLADSLGDLGLGVQNRLAVLAGQRKDEFDRAAFFETVAQNRGNRVRAFRDFERAFEWLMELQ